MKTKLSWIALLSIQASFLLIHYSNCDDYDQDDMTELAGKLSTSANSIDGNKLLFINSKIYSNFILFITTFFLIQKMESDHMKLHTSIATNQHQLIPPIILL